MIASDLRAALESGEDADVIISVRDSAAIARVVAGLGSTVQVSHRYRSVGALAGRITPAALDRLRDDPEVSYVQRNSAGSGQLMEAVPAAGVDRARSMYALTGRGVRVAVFDSGVDREHPDLQGSVVAERCFTRSACAPWNTDLGTDAMDDNGHGTAVAGVIASRGVRGPRGFAPEVEIVSVKVHGADNRGQESDWLAALEWIYENRSELEIAVLNMSVGSDALYDDAADCDRAHPPLSRALRNLVDAGITVVAAGGNLASTTQLPAPACLSGVIAVGATYDADVGAAPPGASNFLRSHGASFAPCRDPNTQAGQIACYTNAPARLDVLAPGGPMLTLRRAGETLTAWGTSQSAAAVSGMAALLRQCNPTLRPAELRNALVATGEPHKDARSGLSFPFVRAAEAARAACPMLEFDAGPSTTPPPASEPAAAGSMAAQPPAAADGGMPAAAGSSAPPRRDGSELQGRYTGPAPATPLDPRPPRREQAEVQPPAAPGRETERAEPRTESVSSCSAAGHPRSNAPLGMFGLLLLVSALRSNRRCRCPRRRCGCLAARRTRRH